MIGWELTLRFLYFGGLHASIAYGIWTKPPLLMQFWYTITNNEKELMRMQQMMGGGGGMPGMGGMGGM